MTDRRIARLTDSAHRLFVLAMAWSAGNRTDGELTPADLQLIPCANRERADELVAAGLWRRTASGWVIVDFQLTQTTRAQHEANERTRAQNRERQQRHRERKAENGEQQKRDDERDVTRDMTREIPGQARTGQDAKATHNENRRDRTDELSLAAQRNWDRGCDS